jgi:hypothetical protein
LKDAESRKAAIEQEKQREWETLHVEMQLKE